MGQEFRANRGKKKRHFSSPSQGDEHSWEHWEAVGQLVEEGNPLVALKLGLQPMVQGVSLLVSALLVETVGSFANLFVQSRNPGGPRRGRVEAKSNNR